MKTTRRIRQIRQGDVLLIPRPAPPSAIPEPDLAGLRVPGERTGHAHVLPASVFDADGERLLYLEAAATMTHEEHAPVEVPAGWWEVRLQRQYTPARRPSARSLSRARFD